MPKLALGTAQLGLDYGISNKSGKPSKEKAFSILEVAYNKGIGVLDTAYAYGNSEKIIGDYMREKNREFKICSKFPSTKSMNCDSPEKIVNESLERLGKNFFEYYFLHDIKDINDENLVNFLKIQRDKGLIKNLGVSVYEPKEAKNILNSDIFDAIQIPLNIFDRRMIKEGLIKDLQKNDIKIFVRSIFLQGLFFLEPNQIPENLSPSTKHLSKIKEFTKDHEIELTELIFSWFKQNEYGDYLVIGVEDKDQLLENINAYHQEVPSIVIDKFNKVVSNIQIPDESVIIDPRRW